MTAQLSKNLNSKFNQKSGTLISLGLMAAISLALSQSVAFGAEEVGKSVRIKNNVSASIGNRKLSPNDLVFESEKIIAGQNSHGELRLNDNSKVLVGENSVVSLDDFVVGSRGFDSGTFKVAKGAFRLVTGKSKKNAMKVKTPLATIGARGTIFDVYVGAGGVTRVILFSGAVEVCSSGNCIVTDKKCDIVEVRGSIAKEMPFLRSGNRAKENSDYELIDRQGRFRTGWRAPAAGCYARAAIEGKVPRIKKNFEGKGRSGNDRGQGQPSHSGDSSTPTGPSEGYGGSF